VHRITSPTKFRPQQHQKDMPSSKKCMQSESKSMGAKFPMVSKQSESQVAPKDQLLCAIKSIAFRGMLAVKSSMLGFSSPLTVMLPAKLGLYIVIAYEQTFRPPLDLPQFRLYRFNKPYPRPSTTFATQVMMMRRQEFDIGLIG
jgi:hypothetical protein